MAANSRAKSKHRLQTCRAAEIFNRLILIRGPRPPPGAAGDALVAGIDVNANKTFDAGARRTAAGAAALPKYFCSGRSVTAETLLPYTATTARLKVGT